MHPQVRRCAQLGDGVELVDGAGVGGAEVGDDGEEAAARAGLGDGRAQRSTRQAPPLVGGDEHDVDVHHPGGGVDRGVGIGSGGEAPPPSRRITPQEAGGVAGRHEGRQVGGRAPADEAPAGALGEPGEVGEPLQRLVLGRDRPGAALPQPAEDARGADDEVEQVGGRRRRGGHVGEVHGCVHGRQACISTSRNSRSASWPPMPSRVIVPSSTSANSRPVARPRWGPCGVQPFDGVADHRLGEQVGGVIPAVHARQVATARCSPGWALAPRRGELGRTALEERLHALGEVGTIEALPHVADRLPLGGAETGVQLGVHLTLHDRHRCRRRRHGEVAYVVLGRRQHLVGGEGPVDESDAGRPRRPSPFEPCTAGRGRGPGRPVARAAMTAPTRRRGRAGRTTW